MARETGQSLHRLVCLAQLATHLVKGHTIGTTKGTHTLPQTLSGEGGRESLARKTRRSLYRLFEPAQLATHLVKGHTSGRTRL